MCDCTDLFSELNNLVAEQEIAASLAEKKEIESDILQVEDDLDHCGCN